MCMKEDNVIGDINNDDLLDVLEDIVKDMSQYKTPEIQLSDEDLVLDDNLNKLEEHIKSKRYNYKTMEKRDMSKKEYFTNIYGDSYTKNADSDHKFAEQINGLWQEIKRMQSYIDSLHIVTKAQESTIQAMIAQINKTDKDQLVEINDRLDDIESRLDLIDE